ncbi:MAG: glycosyltransferase family 2 protein, partial [Candidatus Paceibacterales bacterium]
ILQINILDQNIRIEYLEDALIFDEKVSTSYAFKEQRKRWVSSQFIYFRQYLATACKKLFKGNLSYFNLAVAANLVLPRALLLLILPFFVLLSFFVGGVWGWMALLIWAIYLITMLISLPATLINSDFFHALLRLPKAVFLMAGTLFHLRKANKVFIHTAHTKTEVSNVLFNDKPE